MYQSCFTYINIVSKESELPSYRPRDWVCPQSKVLINLLTVSKC